MNPHSIIPVPQSVEITEEEFRFSSSIQIHNSDFESSLTNNCLTSFEWRFPSLEKGENSSIVEFIKDSSMSESAYLLKISAAGVSISARDESGVFYGFQSFLQLIELDASSNGFVAPQLTVTDKPRYSWRGMHLDVSRYFMNVEDVKGFIDLLAFYKINIMHWHLTDDQGWRIEIKKYPKLAQVASQRNCTIIGHTRDRPKKFDKVSHGGYYTHEEIKDIVEYAADRYITILPEIDVPGHVECVLAAYPEFACTDQTLEVRCDWGISQHILNPKKETVDFVKDILDEVVELFPCEYIHLGGDEAHKYEWTENREIQKQMADLGLASDSELQRWFIEQLVEHLATKGRKLIGWNEILEGGRPKEASVMAWIGGEKVVQEAIQQGAPVVIASHEYTYFDYSQKKDAQSEPLNIGRYLSSEKVYRFGVDDYLTNEERENVIGVQGQLWREYMPTTESVYYMAFPRLFCLAHIAWNSDNKNWKDFKKSIEAHKKVLEEKEIPFYKGTLDEED